MNMIDLHMHTTVSDGTDAPEEIILRVKEAGLSVFSVTDHDAVKGCAIIQEKLRPGDPEFLCGVEFSTKDEKGMYHILGYGYNPASEAIKETIRHGHSLRMEKLRARLDFIRDTFDIRLPEEAVRELFSQDNPGKPHIANLMVKYGYAESKDQAIRNYLNRFHMPNAYVRPEEAIKAILAGNGIPVLAHPFYGNGDQLILGDEMVLRLLHLMDFGLQGVEAFYSGFSPKMREEILALADRYSLYVTAGSDYHGKNKMVSLGDTGLDAEKRLPGGMLRFFEAVRKTPTK